MPGPVDAARTHHHHHGHRSGGYVEPPGPGDGWGFPNGNPDGYGWHDPAPYLPLGADRTAEYYFPRYFAVPPEQVFMGTYYNPYVNRGPALPPLHRERRAATRWAGRPLASAETPVQPVQLARATSGPSRPDPRLQRSGRSPVGELGQDRPDALTRSALRRPTGPADGEAAHRVGGLVARAQPSPIRRTLAVLAKADIVSIG